MDNNNYTLFIKTIIILILVVPILLLLAAILDITIFENLSKIGDSIGGITAPLIGILGVLLVYFTFEQQRLLLNREINKDETKYRIIKETIINNLKGTLKTELTETRNEIIQFLRIKDNQNIFIFRECSNFNSNIFNSIPTQELFAAFDDKIQYNKIVFIYTKIDFVKKFALHNLFMPVTEDYSGKIDYYTVLNKHQKMLSLIPDIIEDLLTQVDSL